MLPIYDNRLIVGYAKTAKQAQKIVSSLLQHTPRGWKVSVRLRDTSIVELPSGWVYSVHP